MPLVAKKRPPVHYKKRQALHHRQSKHYLKPYWPYLPMLLIVLTGFIANSFWLSAARVLGSEASLSRSGLLADTNQDRVINHEPPLKFNADLNSAAQNKANDLVKNNYWAHNSPSGKTPWTFIIGNGYQFQQAGENLAYGFTSSTSVITAWMNSPEHRANMLNGNFEDVGFGIAESPNYLNEGPKVIVVAEYGEPLIAVPPLPVNTATNVNEPSSQTVSRLQILTGASATWAELLTTAAIGAGLAIFVVRYGLYLRKLFFKGELFVVHHPLLDISFVLLLTTGLVLGRGVGLIG